MTNEAHFNETIFSVKDSRISETFDNHYNIDKDIFGYFNVSECLPG